MAAVFNAFAAISAALMKSDGRLQASSVGIITHVPVMLAEVLHHARPRPGEVVVDCTVGDGGHARALLEALGGDGVLIGLDVDAEQVSRARNRLGVAPNLDALDGRQQRWPSVSL